MARPSLYQPETMPKLARQKCREGYTQVQLAEYFGVHPCTITEWAKRYPAFAAALLVGRDFADAAVEESLFRRAVGYDVTEITREPDKVTGQLRTTKRVRKHVQPDTRALIFWLKNRRPDLWRDTQDHEITGAHGGPIKTASVDFSQLSTEDLHALRSIAERIAGPDGD